MANWSDRVLLDTNILVFTVNEQAPQHAACKALYERAARREILACLAPQVLIEYAAVVTAKRVLAKPMTIDEALVDVEGYRRTFPLLVPPPDLLDQTLALARRGRITDRVIFDAALAATMLFNGVSKIYTDDRNFPEVPGITILRP